MIWTVPTEHDMEWGLPASLSNSGSTDMDISTSLQACSLAIAAAYLQSLPTQAVVALVAAQCPGKMELRIGTKVSFIFFLSLSLSLSLSLPPPPPSSCPISSHSTDEYPQAHT